MSALFFNCVNVIVFEISVYTANYQGQRQVKWRDGRSRAAVIRARVMDRRRRGDCVHSLLLDTVVRVSGGT